MVTKSDTTKSKKRTAKQQSIFRFGMIIALIVLVNVNSSFIFKRYDLTADKRYTLSDATKEFLKDLDELVFIKVYLDGDFPPGFERLSKSTRELLDEMRMYAGDNIQYEFINPSANENQDERNRLYQQLSEQGLQPTNLESREEGGTNQLIIFPGCILSSGGKEAPLMLLKDQLGVAPEQMLNNSMQGLEYEFINAIKKLRTPIPPAIAILRGHGELLPLEMADLGKSLAESYEIKFVEIAGQLNSLKGFDLVIIARPLQAFTEKDKYILDQFIMSGGKVLWMLDHMNASMDSLVNNPETFAVYNDLNLEDMLFRYGVRVNPDLVIDLQSVPIPLVTGYIGNQPRQTLMPWYFFPLVSPVNDHPIVKNINSVWYRFASSMDTVGSSEIRKSILLKSSPYSKLLPSPVRINLNILRDKPDSKQFTQGGQFLAVLLEGSFTSNFKNRLVDDIAQNQELGFIEQGKYSKMVVISDGDLARNETRKESNAILPLGFDRYTNTIYGNKAFLLNIIDYLVDDSNLISLRAKDFKLRLLDNAKVSDEESWFKTLNISGPVLIILLLGVYKTYRRKRKFAIKVKA